MSRAGICLVLCLGSACVPAYRPPSLQEPHAIVKFRRVYAHAAGSSLSEALTADGRAVYAHTVAASRAGAPLTDVVLVHPRPTRLVVTSSFFHQETRLVHESYTVQVPYSTMESYSCGFGKSYTLCTRMVTHYRSETRYRTVPRSVTVTDAECARASALAPVDGKVYLLELDFQAPGLCRLACYEQVAQPDGSFTMLPCPYHRSAYSLPSSEPT